MSKNIFLVLLLIPLCGCVTSGKVATTATGSVIGLAVAGPAGAVTGAIAGDVVSEIIVEPILKINKKKVVVEQKVDSVWSLLAKLGETLGWVVGAVLIIPMLIPLLLGYIIPSPRERSKK